MKFKKIIAFTLAEILITLAIVGAVAAMTIPTLRSNHIKKERSVRLQRFYSQMESAVLAMEQDYGSFRDIVKPASADAAFTWYMEKIDPYMGHKVVKTNKKTVYFSDGSSFNPTHLGSCLDSIFDANGDKAPNREGYDRFRFLYCFDDSNRRTFFGNTNMLFGSYGTGHVSVGTSRDAMLQKCRQSAATCTRLLQNDQWEFKDDYPYKF